MAKKQKLLPPSKRKWVRVSKVRDVTYLEARVIALDLLQRCPRGDVKFLCRQYDAAKRYAVWRRWTEDDDRWGCLAGQKSYLSWAEYSLPTDWLKIPVAFYRESLVPPQYTLHVDRNRLVA